MSSRQHVRELLTDAKRWDDMATSLTKGPAKDCAARRALSVRMEAAAEASLLLLDAFERQHLDDGK